jgi:enolase
LKLKRVIARQILDSRGNPTIECELQTLRNTAIEQVPSGASTGSNEALELRDNNKEFHGMGVKKAIKNVEELENLLIKRSFKSQREFDKFLIDKDGTRNKSKLGANAILALSLAFARLYSKELRIPLYKYISRISRRKAIVPVPFMNVINGGVHAEGKLKFQEFMIVPFGKDFKESVRIGSEIYQALKEKISTKFGSSGTRVGDEGGFAPNLTVRQALNLLVETIDSEGYNNKVKLALDVAASEIFDNEKYFVDGKKITASTLIRKYQELVVHYPIISIEDPFNENSFSDFARLHNRIRKTKIVGDDLTVTNISRIKQAIAHKSCNALLLKVNQIGTLTEAIDAARLAFRNNWSVMVSHRSGETESTFIADLAVGLGCGMIKAGAPCRGERTAKYNRLLRIEEDLGKFAGRKILK